MATIEELLKQYSEWQKLADAEEIAPNGVNYKESDITYLLNRGYTRENAIAILSGDPKYNTSDYVAWVNSPTGAEKAPNGQNYKESDIEELIKKGMTREQAIEALSNQAKYAYVEWDSWNQLPEASEVAPNGKHYKENDIQYLMDRGQTREQAIETLSTNPRYTNTADPSGDTTQYIGNPAPDTTTEVKLDDLRSGNESDRVPIKRMELIYKDIDIKFAINPEDYTQKEPNKASLTQTKGGAWIDAWGAGIPEFTLKGITGVSGRKTAGFSAAVTTMGGNGVDEGYSRWRQFRDLYRTLYRDIQDGQPVTELIKFMNYTDNEYWYCYPTPAGIELYRSKSRPHVYQYTISLWGIRRVGDPETSTSGIIGNPYKEGAGVEAKPDTEGTEMTSADAEKIQNGENINPESEEAAQADAAKNRDGTTTVDGTQTNKDTTAVVSGGNDYYTGSVPLDVEADVTITTNTRTKTKSVLKNQAHAHAEALAPLIGGRDGKIQPAVGYGVAEQLQINDSGIVFNVTPFKGKDLMGEDAELNLLMREIVFANVVTLESYEMWKNIKKYSPYVLSPTYMYPVGADDTERVIQAVAYSKEYDSTLWEYIMEYKPKYYITRKDLGMLALVMLESMMVYRGLERMWNNTDGNLREPITPSYMSTLISNIHAVIMYLEKNSTEVTEWYTQNIAAELRQLEGIMLQVNADIIMYM